MVDSSSVDVAEELARLGDGWSVVDEHHLSRTFSFPDFVTALAFVNRVGEVAESQGHHPNISFTWGTVTLDIWTHDSESLTAADFKLAAAVGPLA